MSNPHNLLISDRIFHLACQLLNYISVSKVQGTRRKVNQHAVNKTEACFDNFVYGRPFPTGKQTKVYTKGLDGRVAALLIIAVKILYYLDGENEM